MIPNTNELIAHVAGHAGVTEDRAERATRAVLAGVGAYLSAARRELVAGELPAELAAAVVAGDRVASPIEERVREPGTTAGQARELVASVCRVLVEELSTEALAAVREDAPPGIAALLAPVAPEEPPRAPPGANRETLAEGRPGSRRPVSEARAERTQAEAVAAANPHAATKLSSTTGSTQERLHDTLAEGHIEPDHPVADPHR